MDLAIVCPGCMGTGYRVTVVGYHNDEFSGEVYVPRECRVCEGTGRLRTSGWSYR